MSKKLGFIGCGNMGKAMIHGVLASGKAQAKRYSCICKDRKLQRKECSRAWNQAYSGQ